LIEPDAIRAVALDCDGVMFDTTRANRAYYNYLRGRFRRPPLTPQQVDYVQAHTVDQSIAHLFPEPKLLQKVQHFRRTVSYLPFLREMEIEPHLKPLLDRLRPRYGTAVATNRTDTLDRILQAHDLQKAFDIVVTAADVPHPKPSPDSLQRILNHFDLPPQAMIYVGDSSLDEQAARAAGVPFIAYRNRRLTAGRHIESLAEVGAMLGL
jgi:HAD superfamily hydrolase (TIGR01509 family)